MKKVLNHCFTSFIVCSFLVMPSFAADNKSKEAEALFEKKCNQCHSSERPKSKKKTPQEWETTVMRMKNKSGSNISDEEARMIIDYLSKKYSK